MTIHTIYNIRTYDQSNYQDGDKLSTELTQPLVECYKGKIVIKSHQLMNLLLALSQSNRESFTKILIRANNLNRHCKPLPSKKELNGLYAAMKIAYNSNPQQAYTNATHLQSPHYRKRNIKISPPTNPLTSPSTLITRKDITGIAVSIRYGILTINTPWENTSLKKDTETTNLHQSFGKLYDHLQNNNTDIPRDVCPVLHELLEEGIEGFNNINIIKEIYKRTAAEKTKFTNAMIIELKKLKQQKATPTNSNESLTQITSPTTNENNYNTNMNNNISAIETKDLEPKDTKQKSSKNKKIRRNHENNFQSPLSKLCLGPRKNKNNQNKSQIQINNTKDNNTYTVALTGGADINTVKTLMKDVIKETKNLDNIKENKYLKHNHNNGSFESLEGDFKYEKKGENTHIFTFPNKDAAANFVAKLRQKDQISKRAHKQLCEKLGVDATKNLEKYKNKEITGEQPNIQLTTMNAPQPTNPLKNRKHPNTLTGNSQHTAPSQKKEKGNRNNDNVRGNDNKQSHKNIKNKNASIENRANRDSTDNTNQESNNNDPLLKL